jgi:quinol monooxygenase YgiN
MKLFANVLFAVALLLFGSATAEAMAPAPAPSPVPQPSVAGPVQIVTYIDVSPSATPAALAALRQYRNASRNETNYVALDIYQEVGSPNRFMLLETWAEQPDFEAHTRSANSTQLAAALKPIAYSPIDIRPHRNFSVAPRPAGAPNPTLFVMTHLDVGPPRFAMLQAAVTPFVDASRRENGVARFDLLQGVVPRTNHLTLIEAWSNEQTLDAHRRSAHSQKFREDFTPLAGSLHDDRVYRVVN